jgi:IS5 family transposase
MSFMRFLELDLKSPVPDAKTIWAFREKLVTAQAGDTFFEIFLKKLEESGYITKRGSIVDATFVKYPASATLPKRTQKSKKAKFLKSGKAKRTSTRKPRKTQMHAGPRKAKTPIMATKITSKSMPTAN